MTVAARLPRSSAHDRIAALEKRADGHDLVISPMAGQVREMYEQFARWRSINWFVVKVLTGGGALMGFAAIMLTIIEKAMQMTGHH
jgi:hypothetical protein